MTARCDFLVIGAGPAGMAAAATAASLGVSTLLVDEQSAEGGQIYRQFKRWPETASSVTHGDREHGMALLRDFQESGAACRLQTQVWQLDRHGGDCRVYVTDGLQASTIAARRVLIATGAMERPVPFAGWTLPGVMTVGAAQILYKTSHWLPPSQAWLAGSGPLLWLYAAQVVEAGARVAGILDTTPRVNAWQALAHAAGALRNAAYLKRGLALQRLVRRAGITVIQNVRDLAAIADDGQQLAVVRYRIGHGWREIKTPMLLLHHGVVPHTHAARSLGAMHQWSAAQRCFVPVTDRWGNLPVKGYAVAGDCAGIVGAQASELQGRLAALEAVHEFGAIDAVRRDALAAPLRIRLERHLPIRPFLDRWFAPRANLLVPHDDVLVCRCESVSARRIREAVALGCVGPNQMKAFTRCGMGPCQGRMCGLAAAEIIAAARGVGPGEVGVFNVRSPLKPLSLGELAALQD